MYGDSVVRTFWRDERAFTRDGSTLWKGRMGGSLSFSATPTLIIVRGDDVNLLDPARERWSNIILSLLRIVAALIFMPHGSQKLFGFPLSGAPVVAPLTLMSQTGLAGVLEFFGGLLLLVGLFTRPVAFIVSGEMAV